MNDTLTEDTTLPPVPAAPAPWDLCGQGYMFLLWMPQDVLLQGSFTPPDLQRVGSSRLAIAMFVDYAQSKVGPYHELLYIPGRFRFGHDDEGRPERHWSITRIFVSTWESVVNGRRNWGIPKDRCDFDVQYGAAGADEICLRDANGHVFAELGLRAYGPRRSAPRNGMPDSWRRLSQIRNGLQFTYTPRATGHFRLARVRHWRFNSALFPDLSQGRLLTAVRITDFRMEFPISGVKPASAGNCPPESSSV